MPVSISLFFDRLRTSEILEPDEVDALWQRVPVEKRKFDAEKLVPKLIESKKLTRYQAYVLFKGNNDPLLLGDYVILERIGQGGMGQVFKAEHRRMKRVVALKILPPDAVRSTDGVRRFQREVQAAARLLHSNIVTAFDAGQADDTHFLVMEYVSGRDLSEISKSEGALPVARVMEYVLQTARGLAYAHGKGVVHRDIKPANLLLDDDGNVKILDMGLARVEVGTQAMKDQLTQSGQVMGTLDYMAPEQAYDTRTADGRSDIYSLGCTMYRLLMGETLFAGDSLVQVIMAHREQPIPTLREQRPDIPAGLDALFQQMLAKSPEDRPASMNEVVSALESLKGDSSTSFSALVTDENPELNAFLSGVGKSGTSKAGASGVIASSPATPGPGTSGAGKPSRPPPRESGSAPGVVAAPPVFSTGSTAKMGHSTGDTNSNALAPASTGNKLPAKPASRQRAASAESNANFPALSEERSSGSNLAREGSARKPSGPRGVLGMIGLGVAACVGAALIAGIIGYALNSGGKTSDDNEKPTVAGKDKSKSKQKKLPTEKTRPTPGGVANTPDSPTTPPTLTPPTSEQPLPAGPPPDKLVGLLADPPRILNLGRWQVDTAVPRKGVSSVAWAADNKRLAVAGEGGEIRIYEAATWKLQNVLVGHTALVRAIAWSPDGSRLVSCSDDKTVRLWRSDGTPGPLLPGYTKPAAAKWSPDGEWVAVADADNKSLLLQLWSKNGEPGPTFFGHASGIWGLSWHADSKQFITCSDDKTLRTWNVDKSEGKEIVGHEEGLRGVSWGKGGQIAAVDAAGSVYVHPADGSSPKTYSKINAKSVAWNGAGNLLAVGNATNVDVWNIDGQSIGSPKEATGGALGLDWSPDDTLLAWAGVEAGVCDPAGTTNSVLHCGTPVTSLAWHPDGSRFTSVHGDGRLRWWSSYGLQEEASPPSSAALSSVSWSPTGQQVAACGATRLFLWTPDRTPASSFDLSKRNMRFLAWNAAGDQLVAGGDETKLNLFSTTGTAGPELSGHTKPIQGVAWCRTSGQIASSSADGTVRLWKPDGVEGPVITVANPGPLVWNPDGTLLAVTSTVGGGKALATLWNSDGTTGPELVASADTRSLAWSPDGQKIAGADKSGIKVWSRAGALEKTLTGPFGAIKNVAWSQEGRILASGDDRAIRCWDEATGQLLWAAAAWSGGEAAAVTAEGKPLGSVLAAEKALAYFVERGGGRIEVVSSSEFEKL